MEHLNLYGDFYIPEVTACIQSSNFVNSDTFKSNWLRAYFYKSMLPKENLNKMKTFKSVNLIRYLLDVTVLDRFLNQQKQLLNLLSESNQINLTKTKTSISISKRIKLRLGDAFRVVIYHNLRHVIQANNLIKN